MGLFESMKSIDWEQESFPHYHDFGFLPLFAVFFPSIQFLLDRFVFEIWPDQQNTDEAKVEVFIHVCCWILHIFYIRVGLLGNKTV